ncbi:MAG: exodeoxyribonuclease VII small subunit [Thermodesulfobacteriota bacterium]|jgi:exodeoxyribonuclease VII small subunit
MKSYEDSLDELKAIIGKLEGGNLSLEESLDLFQEGTRLITLCHKKLNEVQKRVEILVEASDGQILRKEFDLEE